MKRTLLFGGILFSFLGQAGEARANDELIEKLKGLEGVEFTETTTDEDRTKGLRRMSLTIEQPVDHWFWWAKTFKQKLVLFHRDFQEPMLLHTSGYKIFSERLSRLAILYETNQIQVEHRYFDTSRPDPLDWSRLTVFQSAVDFHRIVKTFKEIYPGRWVNTGASKGGMTSIYHKRFYPHDLDGTVADVAPLSFSTTDQRYIQFVDQVGGATYAECRTRLEAFQRMALSRRHELQTRLAGDYKTLGGLEGAFEHVIIELPFAFWQYGNPENAENGCNAIPDATATLERMYEFIVEVNDPTFYSDKSIELFQPYYYQAARELGAPDTKRSHLLDLLKFPYELVQYLPGQKPVHHRRSTMKDMEGWVAHHIRNTMFVYGEFDPWTAGAFTKVNRSGLSDNHWFLAPKANHGANILQLETQDKVRATSVLSRWMGKEPVQDAFVNEEETLEDELFRRRLIR